MSCSMTLHQREEPEHMSEEVRWERYARVSGAAHARAWLAIQGQLCAANTVEAYGRSLEDYLAFCAQHHVEPEVASRAHIAAYVGDLAARPHPRGTARRVVASGVGLSNATM